MSDTREPRPAAILASDAERERRVALLRDAVGEGRLTLEEFSERVGLAQAARTDHELARLTRDLPDDSIESAPPAAGSKEHRAFCSHLIRSGPRLTIHTRGPGGTLNVRARPTVKQVLKSVKRAIKG